MGKSSSCAWYFNIAIENYPVMVYPVSPTTVTVEFQSLGLGVLHRFLPSPKTGTELQRWNPGTLEPDVGLQSWLNVMAMFHKIPILYKP